MTSVGSNQKAVRRFSGAYAALSNSASTPIVLGGLLYPTAEHAFLAARTLDMQTRARIANAPSVAKALTIARYVQIRPGWDEYVMYAEMLSILRVKFSCPESRAALLATSGRRLINGNETHDQEWGDCTCGAPSCQEPGRNHLGNMLVVLRREAEIRRVEAHRR